MTRAVSSNFANIRSQESEAEKQSVMEQFAQLVAAKSAVQDEVRPLVAEVDRLRVQITEFGERKAEIVVRVVVEFSVKAALMSSNRNVSMMQCTSDW